ncbi:MAG: glycosyltransferase family 4 protein [Chroococcales cyanobacterium]
MKILIQHRHFQNEISGVLTYIQFLKKELEQKEGIQVRNVSTRENPIQDWLKMIAWADIVHMNSNDFLFALISKLFRKKIIIKYHYSFYLSAHANYEPMALFQRIKTELYYSLPKSNYPLKWKLYTVVKLAKLLTRFATASLADYHTSCSRYLAESYSFHKPIYTLYNPISIGDQTTNKSLSNLVRPYTFAYVGRLNPDKGIDILLKAVKILQKQEKDCQVIIIGDGEDAGKLQKMVTDLEITSSVQFLGQLSHDQVLEKVREAIALIAPSRWQDPAPYVVLEASSVQTCSIVSRMGGLPEMAGSHGFLFNNEDASGLAEAMAYCLDHPEEAIARGIQAHEYVKESFSPTKAAEEFLEICQKVSR